MPFSLQIFFYQACIDPILSRLHGSVIDHAEQSQSVLDVACGTGALAMSMAQKVKHVIGIDLSDESIAAAKRMAQRREIKNVRFEVLDAGDLSCYAYQEFDLAVTSMAIHQFDADLAVKILTEMKRISRKMIIVDYNHHMPRGWGRNLSWAIECLAGGNHYRNFRNFMKQGGIHHFARQADIKLTSEVIRGRGVFVVAETSEGLGDKEKR